MNATSRPQRLKVALVLQNLGAGGAERVMVNLAHHLDRKRFEVDLVLLANRGASHITLDESGLRLFDWKFSRVLFSIPRFIRYLTAQRPDTVLSTLGHINILMAMIRPFFPKMRFIGREANIPSMEMAYQRNPRLLGLLFRLFYPKLDGVVCQSSDMRADLATSFGVAPEKLHLIHNPVDSERIDRLAETEGNPFPPGGRNILFVGRLQSQKDPEALIRLIESFAPEEDYRLQIVGDGALRLRIEALVDGSPARSRIRLWGLQKNPFRFMRHADVLVLTSTHEGFPNAILEANVCGLPVVAFRAPGVNEEIITEGVNGTLVEGRDLGSMARSIRRLLSHRLAPETIRRYAVRNFGISEVLVQYERLLEGK
jgi:glycosyltransferase involved in cell wall biosynthesis